ncbi:hypothetical protein FHR20_000358 [Sphingomonas leidyi]|uniref:Uncharacterized protein n=1 Tax=Sphingomonas leidyi TaxID=68569 RepID=A0A7X5UWA9_9SPHN|nr:hypothetical protein [Sphingomonas leidyi]NIJ63427.1 hypothetical protein [Sphingomonas leidyi]
MSDASEWDGDWYGVTSETEQQELEDELVQELAPGHVLYGTHVVAVGRRWRRDDVLFRLADGRYARLHLTRHKESSPALPTTDIYASFDEWKALPLEDR